MSRRHGEGAAPATDSPQQNTQLQVDFTPDRRFCEPEDGWEFVLASTLCLGLSKLKAAMPV